HRREDFPERGQRPSGDQRRHLPHVGSTVNSCCTSARPRPNHSEPCRQSSRPQRAAWSICSGRPAGIGPRPLLPRGELSVSSGGALISAPSSSKNSSDIESAALGLDQNGKEGSPSDGPTVVFFASNSRTTPAEWLDLGPSGPVVG